MKKSNWLGIFICILCLAMPQVLLAGQGFMGGKGDIVVSEESDGEGEMPAEIEGPLNDNMSTSGALYGDLYKILRYLGGETYTEHIFTYDAVGKIASSTPTPNATAIGGEPVLSETPGYYAAEVINGDQVTYELATAPYPSQCVQPVADFAKWGDINGISELDKNRLPLVVTYDPTWTRSECEVGKMNDVPTVDPVSGIMTMTIDDYFIPPCSEGDCTWNGVVYCDGIKWADLIDEVHFGRLNLSRAPEAVLQAAFDEAINAINKAKEISRDAAGRLLLTTDIYEEVRTSDGDECGYAVVETVTKAIDSPLENLALYVKLMQDGHLVTPGDEREPIDRSALGGIPLWKMLELEDGPSADLRPTVDIDKLNGFFPNLVNIYTQTYYTYYSCFTEGGSPTPCMCWNPDPIQPELDGEWIMCDNVVSRELVVVADENGCPESGCEGGPFTGLMTDVPSSPPDTADLDFAAAFMAAAAAKYESIGPDLVVYLNSILGINKVVGYSAYDADGTPASTAINYSHAPYYFSYSAITGYDRAFQFGGRTQPTILVGGNGSWLEQTVSLIDTVQFQNLGIDPDTRKPDVDSNGYPIPATLDFLGFTQMADDNLSTIKLIHTYQIPGLR